MKPPCKDFYRRKCKDAACARGHSSRAVVLRSVPQVGATLTERAGAVGRLVSSWNPTAVVMTSETEACVLFGGEEAKQNALSWRHLQIARFEPPDEEEGEEWSPESEGGPVEEPKRKSAKSGRFQRDESIPPHPKRKYFVPDDGHDWRERSRGTGASGEHRKRLVCARSKCNAERIVLFKHGSSAPSSDELIRGHNH